MNSHLGTQPRRRGLVTLAVLLTVVLGVVWLKPDGRVSAATECEAVGGTSYVDETESGVTLKAVMAENPNDPSATWVCVLVDGGSNRFGGKAIVSSNEPEPAADVDDTWTYCEDDQDTLVFHAWGLIGPDEMPFYVGVNQETAGGVHLCLMVNNVGKRLEMADGTRTNFWEDEQALGQAHKLQAPENEDAAKLTAENQLAETLATTLPDNWAGGWVNPDGTVTVALTTGTPLPPILHGHDDVHVVFRPHSLVELMEVMQTSGGKIDDLLGPDASSSSAISNLPNVVEITFDPQYQNMQDEIEAALADELAAGTVAINFGEVLVVSEY